MLVYSPRRVNSSIPPTGGSVLGSITINWEDQDKQNNVMWKVPRNIRLNDNIVVREDEIAVFYRDGKVLTYFDQPNRYALTDFNAPIVGNLLKFFTGVQQQAEVYYLQKRYLDGKFGSTQPYQFTDPTFGLVNLRVFGEYRWKVAQPENFINQFVGTFNAETSDDVESRLKEQMVILVYNALGKMKSPGPEGDRPGGQPHEHRTGGPSARAGQLRPVRRRDKQDFRSHDKPARRGAEGNRHEVADTGPRRQLHAVPGGTGHGRCRPEPVRHCRNRRRSRCRHRRGSGHGLRLRRSDGPGNDGRRSADQVLSELRVNNTRGQHLLSELRSCTGPTGAPGAASSPTGSSASRRATGASAGRQVLLPVRVSAPGWHEVLCQLWRAGGRKSPDASRASETDCICPSCGTQNPDGAAFCMKCGAKLGAPGPKPIICASSSTRSDTSSHGSHITEVP